MAFLIHITIKGGDIMKWDEFSPYFDDFYSFVIWNNKLNHKINPVHRMKNHIEKYIKEAGTTLEEQLKQWDKLQGDEWEAFQCWCDVQVGNVQSPAELGEEIGLSATTINKRLSEAGIPKFNGNESNPFGKRWIPNAIKARLVEIILDNTR